MRFFHLVDSIPFLKKWINEKIEYRNKEILKSVLPYLEDDNRILDLGSGTGHTAHSLIKKGYRTVCVDYSDMNIFEDTKPILYDGLRVPFGNKKFDVVLLITVLHHTPNPEKIIQEAARVGKKIIVIEDTYNNVFQKWLTYAMDSIGNMEFVGHPHTNKDDEGWRKVFEKNNLEVVSYSKRSFLWFFESSTYVVKTS